MTFHIFFDCAISRVFSLMSIESFCFFALISEGFSLIFAFLFYKVTYLFKDQPYPFFLLFRLKLLYSWRPALSRLFRGLFMLIFQLLSWKIMWIAQSFLPRYFLLSMINLFWGLFSFLFFLNLYLHNIHCIVLKTCYCLEKI